MDLILYKPVSFAHSQKLTTFGHKRNGHCENAPAPVHFGGSLWDLTVILQQTE